MEKDNTGLAGILLKLADRCEREEPSRELDEAIERTRDWVRAQGAEKSPHIVFEPYTFSLDAAVTLVPEGWRARNMDQGDPSLKYSPPSADLVPLDSNDAGWVVHGQKRPLGRGKTLALALCAAALRARAALLTDGAEPDTAKAVTK